MNKIIVCNTRITNIFTLDVGDGVGAGVVFGDVGGGVGDDAKETASWSILGPPSLVEAVKRTTFAPGSQDVVIVSVSQVVQDAVCENDTSPMKTPLTVTEQGRLRSLVLPMAYRIASAHAPPEPPSTFENSI